MHHRYSRVSDYQSTLLPLLRNLTTKLRITAHSNQQIIIREKTKIEERKERGNSLFENSNHYGLKITIQLQQYYR